ncbi:MAG TPA: FAD:protein FMN transferase [Rhizomicrobium sp.]|jgi:thiamine biosynthesis lipoprotein|nr:FAD:protein FMN transferase [Rhizomicrobium sp.]
MSRSGRDFLHTFQAMATPCEVRVETDDAAMAGRVGQKVEAEARRIEEKFSRYRTDSVVARINAAQPFAADPETAGLLQYAAQCFDLSDGLFDITSGVLRQAWKFDGSDRLPAPALVESLRVNVGWEKVSWQPPMICLPPGMEIDLGGVAKEYAVDRALALVRAETGAPALVNFGGDLAVSGPRRDAQRWKVAIASVEADGTMAGLLELAGGALATSGDARRFLLKDGVRYSHILDPRTGWPVRNAPRSVTVAAATCVEAGMTATLAMLQGKRAERFLKREGVRAWCIR